MCGRYITPDEAALERQWSHLLPLEFTQNFNTSPTQRAPVIRLDEQGEQKLEMLQWGFQPTWAKRSWINARSETVFESRAFKSAAAKHRCLVPAIGWYEWKGKKAPKQPFCLHMDGFPAFAFAGISTARETEDGWIPNFAILTRDAESYIADVHDRMPVVLDPDDYEAWLSPETADPASLIGPPPARIQTYPVSTYVNKPQNNGPECLQPVGD